MKFAAASMAPGCANCCQNGTEPSAKSIQAGFFAGSAHGSAVAAAGLDGRADAVIAATASSKRRRPLFIFERAKRRSKLAPGKVREHFPGLFVERRIDLGDLLGLLRRVRRILLAEAGGAAEVEPEVGEARTVAPVAADLLERREQRLALVRRGIRSVGWADVDRPVPLQARGGRDQLADDHVLLQAEQPVDLALDR